MLDNKQQGNPDSSQAQLDAIDQSIEDMLRENAELQAQESSESVEQEDTSKTLDLIKRRQQKQARESTIVYEVSPERLEKLYEKMLRNETDTLDQLLEILASAVGFTGGMQKFLDVAVNQLQLGDINLKKEKFDPIVESMLDNKILALFLNTLTENKEQDSIREVENTINSKLMHGYFNLTQKEDLSKKSREIPLSSSIAELQRAITHSIKELSLEVGRNDNKQTTQQEIFLRKLETLLKKR